MTVKSLPNSRSGFLDNSGDPLVGGESSLSGASGQLVASIAELRTLLNTSSPAAFVLSYYGDGKGGGGPFQLDLGDTTSIDNGGTIIVAADGGRWKRVLSGLPTLQQFGAKGDGTSNDTARVQAAINSGLDLYAESGTYLINTITLPGSNGWTFIGSGERRTVFQAATANQVLFQYAGPVNSSIDSAKFGNFAVKAHANGSSGPAIKLTGFRDSDVFNIEGLTNGDAGFFSLIDAAAAPFVCYSNNIRRPRLYGQKGWSKLIDLNNGGTGNGLNNPNQITIEDAWAVDNVGMAYALDVARSTNTIVNRGLIEHNVGATYIRMGQGTKVYAPWLEIRVGDTGAYFEFGQVSGEYQASDCLMEGPYIGPVAAVLNFNNICMRNVMFSPRYEIGAAPTFINSPGQSNLFLTAVEMYDSAAPVFAKVGGAAGTLGAVTVTRKKRIQQFTRETSYQIEASYTPSGTGLVTFNVSVPAITPASLGLLQIESISVGAFDANTGMPMVSACSSDGSVRVNFTTASACLVEVWVRYVIQGT